MSIREVIDLSSDEETEVTNVSDVKPILSSYASQGITSNRITNDQPISGEYFVKQELGGTENPPYIQNKIPYDSCMSSQALVYSNGHHPVSVSPGSSLPVCRQFWKSGDYELGHAHGRVSRNGQNRLRIHPKFLHSNATSHKWAFGAIAELLDNAVDEVQNGATFVILDKFTNPKNADAALLIQDDGGGMGPESLRRCMSFGFSDKQSDSSIGQYGNGFKTSTMRLGADVIVFSRSMNKSVLTQGVGLLSYTFLRQTDADDIAVPMIDYEFDSLTGTFRRIIRQDAKQFSSNLSTLLKWSPFATEFELLKQFDDIGHHGTKAFVYNLWFNDDGAMELDFESDAKDIIISGAHKKVGKSSTEYIITQKNVATRLQYSLRAYLSVLYLRIPENFKIILRGDIVEPHYIVNDLIYPECIKYNPKVGGIVEAEVITSIGFLNGAPNVRIHGFNVYHRNRLILPFWRVAHNSYGKGRGVVGVLEANFIKPTHDKQDFEKSSVYQKLESRLKDMTYEYWDFHCHLVGYTKSKHPSALNLPVQQLRTPKGKGQVNMNHGVTSVIGVPQFPAPIQLGAALNSQTYSSPGQSNFSVNFQTGLPRKRIQRSAQSAEMAPLKKQCVAVGISSGLGSRHKKLLACSAGQNQPQDVLTMIQENKKLREHCSEHEDTEKKLLLKSEKLGSELLEARLVYKNLLEELRLLDDVKVEKS